MRPSQSNPRPATDDTNMCLSVEQTTRFSYLQPRGSRSKAVCALAEVMRLKLVNKGFRTFVCCLASTYKVQISFLYWYYKDIDCIDDMVPNAYTMIPKPKFSEEFMVLGVHREIICILLILT